MIRSELVQRMADQNPDLSPKDVDRLVSSVFEAIAAHLAAGGRVELRGFGAFSTRERAARTARNPKNGALVEVKAKHAIHFKPGKEIRDQLRMVVSHSRA